MKKELLNQGGHFDLKSKKEKIQELELKTNAENFWQYIEAANKINKELATLKKLVEQIEKIHQEITDNLELIPLLEEQEYLVIENDLKAIKEKLNELELANLLNGPYDNLNCYLEIHPGAGGTESCDWASMLLRMYKMFCEKNNFAYETVEEQAGEEAGIKSATLYIKGEYAFGYLKNEKGVHRLVRISPFDSGARRHTSFASVSVTPEYNTEVSIDIKESDLKIDVYHSSGAGGQSVNTSNSAVRITHLPTKIVVTCQNERSQLKNKEQAMKILKNKIYQLELEKKEQELSELKGSNSDINFGSQIRNYVLEPYKLIKDLRSNYETSNVDKVLNGDIKELIESLLKKRE